jgi:hypothetical protein
MAIHKKSQTPALQDEICRAYEEILDQDQTHETVAEADLRKPRIQTRQRLQTHLQGHLIGFDDLTPWVDHFLRTYIPRGVFNLKNQLRNVKSRQTQDNSPAADNTSRLGNGRALFSQVK